jgi:hypothetical protein
MRPSQFIAYAGCLVSLLFLPIAQAQKAQQAPIPDIHQLMLKVQEHQRALDKVRENYTYSSLQTTQDIDNKGQVKKTEVAETEEFFVNGHQIGRVVQKDGKPLSDRDQQKETERVTKLVEKAQKIPSDQPLQGQQISVSRILDLVDIRNPRRQIYRNRPTIVFDFAGRKNATTHGVAEDATKKVRGTVWVDEADLVVAHMEVTFDDNFRVAGGMLATIEKGSNMHFDQAPLNGEIWLPTGGEGTFQARLLLLKNIHQHGVERDYNYKRFRVDAEQAGNAKLLVGSKPN